VEKKIRRLAFSLLILSAFVSSCSNEGAFPNGNQLKAGEELRASGVFDLKSICLNAGPQNKVSEPYCQGYFSEKAVHNPASIEIRLQICTEQVTANCIDRLPANAPPETITIRTYSGDPIERWGKNTIRIRKLNTPKSVFEVLEIY
jgi:hypothetical protein